MTQLAHTSKPELQIFASRRSGGRSGAVRDFEQGLALFVRWTTAERLRVVDALLDSWQAGELPRNVNMIAGFLRSAWDMEPYVGGRRRGSYFSATDKPMDIIAEVMADLAPEMMTAAERAALAEMPDSLTVFRGGVDPAEVLTNGLSWTTNPAIAEFYATVWPARWGIQGTPLILKAEVSKSQIHARFDEREECELIIPWGVECGSSDV